MGLIFSLFMFYLKSKPWSLEPVKTLLGRSSNDFMDQCDSHLLYTQMKVKAVDLTLVSRCVDIDTLLLMNTVTWVTITLNFINFQSISTCRGMKKMTTIQIFLRQVSSLGGHLGYTPRLLLSNWAICTQVPYTSVRKDQGVTVSLYFTWPVEDSVETV